MYVIVTWNYVGYMWLSIECRTMSIFYKKSGRMYVIVAWNQVGYMYVTWM